MNFRKTVTALALILMTAGLASCSDATSSSGEASSNQGSSITEPSSTIDSSIDDSSEISSEDSSSDDISSEDSSEPDSSEPDSSSSDDSSSSSEDSSSAEPEDPTAVALSTFDGFLDYYNNTLLSTKISNASYTESTVTSTYTTSTSTEFTGAANQTLSVITDASSVRSEYQALEQDETYGEIYYQICDYTSGSGTDYGYKRQLVDSNDELTTGMTLSQGLKSRYEPMVEASFFTFDTVGADANIGFGAFADTSNTFVATEYSFSEYSSGGYLISFEGYHETANSSTWGSCYTEIVGILLDDDYMPTYGEYTAKYASNSAWDFNNHQPSSTSANRYEGTFSDITYVEEYAESERLIDVDSYFVTEITDAYCYGSSSTGQNTCRLEDSVYGQIVSYNPTTALDVSTYSLLESSDESVVSVAYGYGIARTEGTCTLYFGNLFNPRAYSVEFTVAGEALVTPTLDTIVDDNFVANENYSLYSTAADEILGTLTIPASSTSYTTQIEVFGYKKPADSDVYTKMTTGPWNLDDISIRYNDTKDLEQTSSIYTWSEYITSVSITEDDNADDAYLNMTIRTYGSAGSTYVYFPVSSTTYSSGQAAYSYVVFEVVIA